MGKYFLSKKAVDDLAKIWDYTYETWSENQADKYYHFLIDCCQDLADNPDLGKQYDEIADSLLRYKVNHHIIFYKKIETNEIEVVRILHSRMDLRNRIQE